jgi:hypothetical protein
LNQENKTRKHLELDFCRIEPGFLCRTHRADTCVGSHRAHRTLLKGVVAQLHVKHVELWQLRWCCMIPSTRTSQISTFVSQPPSSPPGNLPLQPQGLVPPLLPPAFLPLSPLYCSILAGAASSCVNFHVDLELKLSQAPSCGQYLCTQACQCLFSGPSSSLALRFPKWQVPSFKTASSTRCGSPSSLKHPSMPSKRKLVKTATLSRSPLSTLRSIAGPQGLYSSRCHVRCGCWQVNSPLVFTMLYIL